MIAMEIQRAAVKIGTVYIASAGDLAVKLIEIN